jgi:hypothetical protein
MPSGCGPIYIDGTDLFVCFLLLQSGSVDPHDDPTQTTSTSAVEEVTDEFAT